MITDLNIAKLLAELAPSLATAPEAQRKDLAFSAVGTGVLLGFERNSGTPGQAVVILTKMLAEAVYECYLLEEQIKQRDSVVVKQE